MWKLEEKPGQIRLAKVLYTVNNIRADVADPKTWNTFEACVNAIKTNVFNGIGFVFSYYDDYVGYDLDDVLNPETGQMDPEILQEIKSLDSYTETSQSGKGVHVIFKGKKPGDRCRSGFREMYDKDRFFVMTGNHLEGTPTTINAAPAEAVQAIYHKIAKPKSSNGTPQKGGEKGPTAENEKILSLLMGSSIADKFEQLWDGSTSGYPSNSEADQAIANYIAFYTQDEVQIEGLMRHSGLARSKWDTHPTYLKNTIKNAIDGLTERYTPPSQEGREQYEQQATSEEETDPLIKEAADRIASQEDPVRFILDTHQSLHVGDLELAKTLLVSIGVQSVLNSDGIQPKVSGDSGKGKTHCCKAMAHLVPPEWIFETTLSDKAIFYMKGLKDGSIIFCDDVDLSDTLEGVIKRATSNFQTGTTYTTLDIKRREETKRIPARISWWLTSVDDDQSLQLLNRQFGGGVDESEDQDKKVMEYQLQQAACGEVGLPFNDDVLICRGIIRDIKASKYIVKIPFAKDIMWRDLRNRRNLPIFLDIIKSYAVLRHRQRSKDKEGALIADIQDFNDAKALYTGRAENQGLKLNDAEMKLCIALANRGEATKEEIAQAMGVTEGRVRHLIFGKDKNKDSGLLHRVKGLTWENRTVENSVGHKTQKTYLKLIGFDALGMFDTVVSLRSDSTGVYPTCTHTCTINNNMSRESSTTSTPLKKVSKQNKSYVKNGKSNSISTQKPNTGTSGTSGSLDYEKLGTGVPIIRGTPGHGVAKDSETAGTFTHREQVFTWAALWEKMYNASLNSSNVVAASMEYCQKKKVPPAQVNEITALFRKYAKIPEQAMNILEPVEASL